MNIKLTIASVSAAFALSVGFSGAAFADNAPREGAHVAHSAQTQQVNAASCQAHTPGSRGISTDEVRALRGAIC